VFQRTLRNRTLLSFGSSFLSSNSFRTFYPIQSSFCSVTPSSATATAKKENTSSFTEQNNIPSIKDEAGLKRMKEVLDRIHLYNKQLGDHPFWKFLGDESIPAKKRLSFLPYMTYFTMTFADILDTYMKIENPKTDLEYMVNKFCGEDDFHYNFIFSDLKTLGYTLDRYGTFDGVCRHLWGNDSREVRQLMYTWIAACQKSKDPLLSLIIFETLEAGMYYIFTVAYGSCCKGKDGIKNLDYFGDIHIGLEQKHEITKWFEVKQKKLEVKPLEAYPLSKETKPIAEEVVDDIFKGFHGMYNCFLRVGTAPETIRPEKYIVKGTPPIDQFP